MIWPTFSSFNSAASSSTFTKLSSNSGALRVHPLDRLDHEMGQIVIRDPVAHIRRPEHRCCAVYIDLSNMRTYQTIFIAHYSKFVEDFH